MDVYWLKEMMNVKVYLIEDDVSIFELIKERFAQWTIEVTGPADFHRVMDDFLKEQPQLVIIDIQLPVFDGFHWCREIRAISKVPILFLSSRDHPMDMVMAMQMGADDFVQKPFHMDVLIAKIQAILRRTYDYKEQVKKMVSFYVENTQYTEEEVNKNINTDWYVRFPEALERGLVDEMINDIDFLL